MKRNDIVYYQCQYGSYSSRILRIVDDTAEIIMYEYGLAHISFVKLSELKIAGIKTRTVQKYSKLSNHKIKQLHDLEKKLNSYVLFFQELEKRGLFKKYHENGPSQLVYDIEPFFPMRKLKKMQMKTFNQNISYLLGKMRQKNET